MSIVVSRQKTEFPKYLHHGSELPVIVMNADEERKFRQAGYVETYAKHEYPKTKYKPKLDGAKKPVRDEHGHALCYTRVVADADAEKKLGKGWLDLPPKPEPVDQPIDESFADV